MPKAVQADWELIKALFLQGFTQSQIAARTGVKPGTIKGRAARYGWSLLRRQANASLVTDQSALAHQGLVALTQAQAKAIAKASAAAKYALSGEVQAQLSVLAAKRPRTIAELSNTSKREGRASLTARLVQAADRLYGWQAEGQGPSHVSLTKVEVYKPSLDQPDQPGQAIDVPYE